MTPWRGYRAYLTKPHDGDSFWVMYDAGCEARVEPELRLADVHAPELIVRIPRVGQPGGTDTRQFVADWLATAKTAAMARRWYLWVAIAMTSTLEPSDRRTFTRYVAKVWSIVDCPEWGKAPIDSLSLNSAITTYLSGHPEWPPGE